MEAEGNSRELRVSPRGEMLYDFSNPGEADNAEEDRPLGEPPYQVAPPLTDEEYAGLKTDIAENGVLVPIVEDEDGNVLDGHHRKRAWEELRYEGHTLPDYPREVRSDLKGAQDKRDEAWRLNMQRRHLGNEQKRAATMLKLKETPDYSDRRIAGLLGVDNKTVRSVRTRLEVGGEIPHLTELVGKDGKVQKREKTHQKYPELDWMSVERRRKAAKKLDGMPESIRREARAAILRQDPQVLAELTDEQSKAFEAREIDPSGKRKRRHSPGEAWHRTLGRLYVEMSGLREHEGGMLGLVRDWDDDYKESTLEDLRNIASELSAWIEILEREVD